MIKAHHIVLTVGAVVFIKLSPLYVAIPVCVLSLYLVVYGRIAHRRLLSHPLSARPYAFSCLSAARLWAYAFGGLKLRAKRVWNRPAPTQRVVIVERIDGHYEGPRTRTGSGGTRAA